MNIPEFRGVLWNASGGQASLGSKDLSWRR